MLLTYRVLSWRVLILKISNICFGLIEAAKLPNTDSSPSAQEPIAENNPNTEATPIEVNIYNVCYTVKPPNNLTANDIRELANYIDGLMRRVGRGQGTNDPLSRAILVALNLAARMRKPQVSSEETINQLIAKLDQALSWFPPISHISPTWTKENNESSG